ncbi:hypothetical protein AFB00_25490 [Pseudonocardia sp. HH130630-07]|nr:hypothetical protein AFB00_25490 [Pseudonocardia sp. HH130630-07]
MVTGPDARDRRTPSHPACRPEEIRMLTQILLAAVVILGSGATFREVLRGRPRPVRTRRAYNTRTPSLR